MRALITTARILVRLTGFTLIVLGTLFWAGQALTLIPLHMQVGLVFVISLWALAALAARAGAPVGLVGVTFAWGLVVPVLGMLQDRLLPGSAHWIIKTLHLLVGLGAMGLAEELTARTNRPPHGGFGHRGAGREWRRTPTVGGGS
jgi:hypothetical protein